MSLTSEDFSEEISTAMNNLCCDFPRDCCDLNNSTKTLKAARFGKPCKTSSPRCVRKNRTFEGNLSQKAKKLRNFTQKNFTNTINAAEADTQQLEKELRYEKLRDEMTTDKLHEQSHEKYKLQEENKNLKQLLKNAENQLTVLCEAKERHGCSKRKSLFIVEKCKEQKSVLEKLQCSLARTNRLTKSVQDEIDNLKYDNISMHRNSSKIHLDLESTLDDAKKTQIELEKIERIFRNSVATKPKRHKLNL